MEAITDPVIGQIRRFRDTWRGRPALCLLIGEGSGPQDEGVRIVGIPQRGGGFTVNWVISYEPGSGNARRAYEFLVREYGGEIRAMEVRSETGLGFHQAMKDLGLVSFIEVDISDASPTRKP